MQKFNLRQRENIWWGEFAHLSTAGFINGCSCRLHGDSKIVPGSLNLALHVGDDREMVLRNRDKFSRQRCYRLREDHNGYGCPDHQAAQCATAAVLR